MNYKIIANFENGKTRTFEVKGMISAIKLVDRLKVTSNVVTCKNKLIDYKINKAD